MATTPPNGNLSNIGNSAIYMTVDGEFVGLCLPTTEFEAGIETSPVQFGSDTAPRGEKVNKQSITLNFTLAEVTNANFKRYLGNFAEIDGSNLYYGDKKGQFLPLVEVKLYPLHPDGHPWAGQVFTLHQCTIKPNGSFTWDPTDDNYEGFPITITVMKDSTQTAGREFFSVAPADAVAPTVSSTTPTNGATSVAIDADIVINFSKAMGDGTIGDASILITTTGKTGTAFNEHVDPTSYTLNTARTQLTIAHGDLTAGTEYQVILGTNLCSAGGVGLAAPYVFTFTTAA
ncbi:MAG: Ig-like domain-containing protein [Candidatus Omnitrophota bacterium]